MRRLKKHLNPLSSYPYAIPSHMPTHLNRAIKALLILCISNWSPYSYGQSSPIDISSKFFELYKNAGPNQAVDYVFSTNKYASESQKDISNIKTKLQENAPLFGKYTGYELLSTKTAGKDLQLLTFIVKHDHLPLVFKLLFYRPESTWEIQDFTFATDIDNILTPSN